MNILILTGSPHSNGTTAYLTNQFIKGIDHIKHDIERFDTAKLKIHECKGCNFCQENGNSCIFNDDMSKIYPHLIEADIVVLVTLLYYLNMTAYLKNTIDRFYAVNNQIKTMEKN